MLAKLPLSLKSGAVHPAALGRPQVPVAQRTAARWARWLQLLAAQDEAPPKPASEMGCLRGPGFGVFGCFFFFNLEFCLCKMDHADVPQSLIAFRLEFTT